MAWYAYCIAERNAFPELCRHRRPMPLTGVAGLFGNQVFLFPASELAVIVSEHTAEDSARMDQSAAKDHARVIAECFKLSTGLPFRFGTTFPDDDALRRSVRSNQRHFTATSGIGAQHCSCPKPGNHGRLSAAVLFGQFGLWI